MDNRKNKANVKPSKEICEKCESHGFCLAEEGRLEYQCWKIFWLSKHPNEDHP